MENFMFPLAKYVFWQYTVATGKRGMRLLNENICRFVSTGSAHNELVMLNFVHEKRWQETAPQLTAAFILHLVTAGRGTFTVADHTYAIAAGDVFCAFQAKKYTLINTDGLEFMYVTFSGTRAAALLERVGLTLEKPLFHGLAAHTDISAFWKSTLDSCRYGTTDLAASAVFYHTLSLLPVASETENPPDADRDAMLEIKKYIDENFRDPSLSSGKIAETFGYSPSYIATQFHKTAAIRLSAYLARLRLEYAASLIGDGCQVVGQIAHACGYTDPLYFSKVFKAQFGVSPKHMIREKAKEQTNIR